MYAADGVGLAACQIGVDRSVFVFDCPDDEGVRHTGVVCNPELFLPEGKDRKLDDDDEGCLSLPGRVRGVRPPVVRQGRGAGPGRLPRRATPAPGCSPGACSTRPTTATARSSATG